LALSLFLGVAFFFNYRVQFKTNYVGYGGDDPSKYLNIFLFFLCPLVVSFILYSLLGPREVRKQGNLLGNISIWGFLIFTALAYTVSVGWTPYESPIINHAPSGSQLFMYMTSSFALRGMLMLLLPGLWWWFRDRRSVESYYGFRWTSKYTRLYFILLGLAIALSFAASLTKGFTNYYPMYLPGRAASKVLGVSPWTLFLTWETVYLMHFVAVEFFFRGYLVMALNRLMGAGSVWVMSSMYMFIHFSKPQGEAIGSFFAGILLGVLSLRTRSIYGGIVVHITAAVSMDLFALIWRGGF
jgi:hypothetical protein